MYIISCIYICILNTTAVTHDTRVLQSSIIPCIIRNLRLSPQVQGDVGGAPSKYSGVIRTIATIFHEEGLGGLYRGLVPGLQRQLAFSTIKLGCYDDVKDMYFNMLYTGNDNKIDLPFFLPNFLGRIYDIFFNNGVQFLRGWGMFIWS